MVEVEFFLGGFVPGGQRVDGSQGIEGSKFGAFASKDVTVGAGQKQALALVAR